MKKFMKRAVSVIMVALLCMGVYAPIAKAEASSVVIHVKDGQSWGSMNVYNWGDNGETAGVWPGTEMTAEADGWYTYTIDTEVPLNLVFSAAGGSPQSSNVNDVAADAGEIWVVIGGEGEANDMGASTNEAVLYLEAEEGWPVASAADTVTDDTAATDAATTDAVVTEDTTATDAVATTDVPKTGEAVGMTVTFLALAAISAAGFIILKKRSNINEM